MAIQNQPIKNFTGGLNDSLDPDSVQDNELSEVLNMRCNSTGNIVDREGITEVVEEDEASFPEGFTSEFEATLSTGITQCIVTAGNDFYYMDGTTPTLLNKDVAVEDSDGTKYRWVFFNDLFIGVSRKGTLPVKWDGDPTHDVEILDTQPMASGLCVGAKRPIDIAIWNRRLAMAQGVELFVSDVEAAELWATGDSFVTRLRGSIAGEEAINALYPFNNNLYCFKKENDIWEIQPGEGVSNTFIIGQVSKSAGCDAPFSIADLGRDLIWFYKTGFTTLSDLRDVGGVAPNGRISQKIYRTFTSQINLNFRDNIHSIYNSDLDELLVSCPIGDSQETNNTVIVLNVEWTKKNSLPSWWIYQYAKEFRGFGQRPSAGKSQIFGYTHKGGMYQLNVGHSDAEEGYQKILKTKRFSFGPTQTNKMLGDLFLDFYQEGTFDVTVQVYLDQERRVKTFTANVLSGGAIFDVSNYDEIGSTWGSATSGVKRRFIGKTSRDVSYRIFTNSSSDLFAINKLIQEYDTLDTDLQGNMSG